jgi:hypothetical protein
MLKNIKTMIEANISSVRARMDANDFRRNIDGLSDSDKARLNVEREAYRAELGAWYKMESFLDDL